MFSIKKLLCLLMTGLLVLNVAACVGGGKPKDETVTIKVALGSLTPSEDMVVSSSNPNPVVMPYYIAQEFMKQNPNIKIEFDRGISYKSKNEWNQYMVTSLGAGRAPDIVFGWNSDMLYKNWYVDITQYMQEANEYEPGNQVWGEMFPDYIFNELTGIDGKIMGVPALTFPGAATVYYCNADIFYAIGKEPPKTWDELLKLNDYIKTTYPEYTTFGTNKDANIKQLSNNWDMQFVLGPAYGNKIRESLDLDGNGIFSQDEKAKAILDNKMSATAGANKDATQDLWRNMRSKYQDILPNGYGSADFDKLWNDGTLAILEDGLWRMSDELASSRRKDNFEFVIVPAPAITSDSASSAQYIENLEVGKGPYQPALSEGYHIVNPALQKSADRADGDKVIAAAVKFLKFITATENLNDMVLEKRGGSLGATTTSEVPPELTEFFENDFYRIDSFRYVAPLSSEGQDKLTRAMEEWFSVRQATAADDNKFFVTMDEIYRTDTLSYMTRLGLDTSPWN